MKILLDTHVIGQQKTGIERYWKNLLVEFARSRIDFHAYIPTSSPDVPEAITQHNSPITNAPYRITAGLPHAVQSIKPDMLHVDYLRPLSLKVPLILTVHDICFSSHSQYYPPQIPLAFNSFFKQSVKSARAIVCVSHSTKSELEKTFDISGKIIKVIPLGVDSAFHFITDKHIVRNTVQKKFSLNNYFLVVGNVEERKNPLLILTAFLAFHKKHPDYQLVFVGPRKMKLSTYHMNHHAITYLGYVNDSDLNLLYNDATALIINSYCEGFGLPIIEAMRCKLPVLCAQLDVFREVAGQSALFFSSSEQLLEHMDTIVTKPSVGIQYGEMGYKRSLPFTWSKTAQATIAVYKRVYKQTV